MTTAAPEGRQDGRRCPFLAGVLVAAALFPFAAPLHAAGDADGGARLIESIRVETGVEGKVGVFFKLNRPFTPRCFSLVGENRRLVCDFPGAAVADAVARTTTVGSDLLQRIRVGRHDEPEFKTRVVLDMDRSRSYDVEQIFVEARNEYVLVIQLLRGGSGP